MCRPRVTWKKCLSDQLEKKKLLIGKKMKVIDRPTCHQTREGLRQETGKRESYCCLPYDSED